LLLRGALLLLHLLSTTLSGPAQEFSNLIRQASSPNGKWYKPVTCH
jgi:hypothetical protein